MMNVEIAHETAKVTFALVDINIGVINQFSQAKGSQRHNTSKHNLPPPDLGQLSIT